MVSSVIFILFFARTDTLSIMARFQLLGNKRRGVGTASPLGWQGNLGASNSSLSSLGTAWHLLGDRSDSEPYWIRRRFPSRCDAIVF